VDSNRGDDRGNNRGDDRGGTRRLMALDTISTVFFNPLIVLVNKEGNLLLKA